MPTPFMTICRFESPRATPMDDMTESKQSWTPGIQSHRERAMSETVERATTTTDLVVTLRQWVEALQTRDIAELSVIDIALFNGGCVTEDIAAAADEIERLRTTPAPRPAAFEAMRRAMQQIETVCADNAGPTVMHNMALKFVQDVASAALAQADAAAGEGERG